MERKKRTSNRTYFIVTGNLGSGKTTLLNYILSNRCNLKIAAAINDYAAINIDAGLISKKNEVSDIVELTNGCMCCSLNNDLKNAVWKMLQEDVDVGRIEYLIIETSGVTDPVSVIRLLEADFGQMYRARLDAVVTVVDVDYMYDGLVNGNTETGVPLNQLLCADVVLLNKVDLVNDTAINSVKDYVMSIAPNARMHCCTRARVPLQFILDVEQDVEISPTVTHETVTIPYRISEVGKGLRVGASESTAVIPASLDHAKSDLESLSFIGGAMNLVALQDFLIDGLGSGIARMKGRIWVAECREVSWEFHCSGRRRYQMTNTGRWMGPSETQLVIIGSNFGGDALLTTLNNNCERPQSNVQVTTEEKNNCVALMMKCKQLVEGDSRFEWLGTNSDNDHLGLFRATGASDVGKSIKEMEDKFRINFGRMNIAIADAVNSKSGGYFICPGVSNDGIVCLQWAVSSTATVTLTDMWPTIADATTHVLRDTFEAVQMCNCGW